MEDVILHYQPGSADGLSALLERTEKLLQPFPCRTPPVFTPWFPTSTADRWLPIRPAKPAPVITSSGDSPVSHSRSTAVTKPLPENQFGKSKVDGPVAKELLDRSRAESPPEHPQDAVCISETPNHLLPGSVRARETTKPSPGKQTQRDGDSSTVQRSWNVFTQKGVLLQSSLSKQFHHTVSVHRLHLRQRAKWVISEHNFGATRDIEQLWRTLSRSVRSSRLPTCNANIQRERAEIWVFCDVLCSEQVGRFLKEELQLSGRISLSVHRLGNIFSM